MRFIYSLRNVVATIVHGSTYAQYRYQPLDSKARNKIYLVGDEMMKKKEIAEEKLVLA